MFVVLKLFPELSIDCDHVRVHVDVEINYTKPLSTKMDVTTYKGHIRYLGMASNSNVCIQPVVIQLLPLG